MNKELKVTEKKHDILSYQEPIWKTADILRFNVTTKEHLYPSFMIPFFALNMVESRLIIEYVKTSEDMELLTEEDRVNEIKENVGFYNSVVIEDKITLKWLVNEYTDNQEFYLQFSNYLNSFNLEFQKLLGVFGGNDTDNLNIETKIKQLKEKNILRQWVAKWAEIDFTPYNNSDITTLEEHIKRRWADMSADGAGQQYTPHDIIDLIAELIITCNLNKNKIIKIYDMTCGGGNMLFGIEDKLMQEHPDLKIATYGQELEGALYSLAKIESKFRKESYIEKGNTLTEDQFPNETFDLLVANPPYGVDWKASKDAIDTDQTGRFNAGKPATSDGQLLFNQHGISKLTNDVGIGFVVFNGSPLFSGDAGSGESDIRKWILDNDYLEALIQLPTNEFFNTGITTYIWCLNKNKVVDRKDKILCINADSLFEKLKKSKGDKTKEIPSHNRKLIASLYKNYTENEISKIKSKYDFYFNKQKIKKIETDDEFGSVQIEEKFKEISKIIIKDNSAQISYELLDDCNIKYFEKLYVEDNITIGQKTALQCSTIQAFTLDKEIQNFIKNAKELYIKIETENDIYEQKNEYIFKNDANLGIGQIKINFIKKVLKGVNIPNLNTYTCIASIEKFWTKDEEKIEYSPINEINQQKIESFLLKWVSNDKNYFIMEENIIGVEINFNNIFPKTNEIRDLEDILADIALIDKELGETE